MLDVAYLGLVRESYRLVGLAMLEKHDGPTGKHQMHIKSVFIPGSTIGVGWFPDGSCSDHVNQHIDNSYRPGLMGTAKLGCHECGHCVGLEHEFSNQNYHRGVMSYNPPSLFYGFSTGKSPHTLPRDPSLDKLIAMYSGKPNPPLIDEPGPIPVPTRLVLDPLQIEMFNGQPIIRNEFKVLGRDFIIVPKPRI